MNLLFVAWKQPDSGEWIPVARLEELGNRYRFSYTQGAYRAKGFAPFDRMDQLNAVYESDSMFPLFANRIISKSRPEYKEYLRWLGLPEAGGDPMSLLALTGGVRGTDSIEVFQPPVIGEDGQYQVTFFARSLSHLPREALARISTLDVGDKLFLMHDCQNTFDQYAMALRTDTPAFFIGFCPKYYAKDLLAITRANPGALLASVKCINPDAPLNMRLLCSVSAQLPQEFSPLAATSDFQPISTTVPATWEALVNSLNGALPPS